MVAPDKSARRSSLGPCLLLCALFCATLAVLTSLSRRGHPPGSTSLNYTVGLREWGIPSVPPITYVGDVSGFKAYSRLVTPAPDATLQPDTTAIVLNWSRFRNVVLIAALLCDPTLDSVISQVFIWNNNPKSIALNDFAGSGCSPEKLRIHNSPSNLLFKARFMACAQSSTPYCFTQDDDYLLRPEIITALQERMTKSRRPSALHLLPPHEHLSSQLRELHSVDGRLHTSFAWLGHGTIFPRADAEEFLELLHRLNFTFEEMGMADNYFSILKNEIPEIWFDQGIELGGGQPFTAGVEGDLRNRRHIGKAGKYLDALLSWDNPPCLPSVPGKKESPYVNYDAMDSSRTGISRSALLGIPGMLETNIRLLPDAREYTADSAQAMLDQEARNAALLGDQGKEHYLRHAPSQAVDGLPDTSFISPGNARANDFIAIDLLNPIKSDIQTLQIVFLVDAETERILKTCKFESSVDGLHWAQADDVYCFDSSVEIDDPTYSSGDRTLRECYAQLPLSSTDAGPRRFRALLRESVDTKWQIHEMWIRGAS
ncbi:hypothetical protein GLOTRDRAFT_134973 [Gloeophyllum trabeum ATCC 11539]|uniref:Uncharacterized protein n=1 Tax=Gloeophyllum trabeum (strain ATCC 11539 / FP-39264 / Madison 617) TaxID=670483 RepID=S7QLJ9_GLOTA|nr:uncharacterized protein GLOTRDRAFT_134973 [Gloeophyllum trabeum ATCC 11539]EPQ60257.1 hypothetical protein GLOTRDRAFT_134973 [Gloeophyllum trabeum ATCC 11539]